MNIPEALRSPQRTLYNYSIKPEKVTREDDNNHSARRIGFASLLAVGVLAGLGVAESNNQEPEQTTRIHSFETVE